MPVLWAGMHPGCLVDREAEYSIVTIPLRSLRTYQFLWNNSVLAGDSSSDPLGHFTFLYGFKKYNRGSGRKRTNKQYGLGSIQNARRASLWHCIPCASVDYRWRVVSRNFYKLLGMPIHLTIFLTADHCRLRTAKSSCLSSSLPLDSISPNWSLLSVVDCPSASPFTNCLLWVPFSNSFSGVPLPTVFSGVPLPTALASLGSAFFPPLPVLSEISILSPLFGFTTRQTKGLSA